MALHIPSNILPYLNTVPELADALVDDAYLPTPLARSTVEGLLALAAKIDTTDSVNLKAAISKLKIQAVLLSNETREYLEELGLGLSRCHTTCQPCQPCQLSPAPSLAPTTLAPSVAPPTIRPITPVSALVLSEGCGENCPKCSHKCKKPHCGCTCDRRCKACHGHGHGHEDCHAAFRKRYAELKEQYARRHADLKDTYARKYTSLKAQYAEREQEIKCKYDERHHAIKCKFNDLKKRYEARVPRCQ